MATPYNPYSMALPHEQVENYRQKVSQQIASTSGRRAPAEVIAKMRESKKIPRVRVEPANDDLRRVLRHPNGMAFRPEGSVEWPHDRFTQRRIADGSIRVVEQVEGRQERRAASRPSNSKTEQQQAPKAQSSSSPK